MVKNSVACNSYSIMAIMAIKFALNIVFYLLFLSKAEDLFSLSHNEPCNL